MITRIALVATLLAGLAGAATIVPAMADNRGATDTAETQAMATASLTLAQASAAAEAEFGGKAIETALDVLNGTPTYTVSLLAADGTESEALVDAVTGTIAAAPLDQTNEQGDEAGQDETGSQGDEDTEAQ
ncbi:MAG: PepSY domain-containing protein [Devosia sp.]